MHRTSLEGANHTVDSGRPEIGEGVGSGVGEEAQRDFPSCPVDYCVVRVFHTENISMYHLGN